MTIKEQKRILYFLELLFLNIESLEDNAIRNQLAELFSRKELTDIVSWLHPEYHRHMLTEKNEEELLSLIGDDVNILSFVIAQWKENMCKVPVLSQEQVTAFLSELQLESHYLNHKAVLDWDSYDTNNYFALLYKRGKTQRVYAIYTADVKKADKYNVTTLPTLFFDTKEEAEQALITFCKQNQYDIMDYVIHWLWTIKY